MTNRRTNGISIHTQPESLKDFRFEVHIPFTRRIRPEEVQDQITTSFRRYPCGASNIWVFELEADQKRFVELFIPEDFPRLFPSKTDDDFFPPMNGFI